MLGSRFGLGTGESCHWVLWVHHQLEFMQMFRASRGFTDFRAINFSFTIYECLMTAQAFHIALEEGTSLTLIPVDWNLIIPPPP